MEQIEALREAMRDPFWTPNTMLVKKHQPAPEFSTSELLLQDFVRGLSRSMDPEHLQTLQNILDEAAATCSNNLETRNAVWWELCYEGLSASIQRLVLYRILHAKDFLHDVHGMKKVPGDEPPPTPKTVRFPRNSFPHTKRPGSATGNKQGRRRRMDKLVERLERLTPENGSVDALPVPRHEQSLSLALSALASLLRVTPKPHLHQWYVNRDGMEHMNEKEKSASFGGMAMVALVLDLLDDLMFSHWKHELSAMHSDRVYSPGKNVGKWAPLTTAIPQWYLSVITLLQRIGRSWAGMELLRTRVPDSAAEDWMANALDVSIQHLLSLALHWDDVRLEDGAVLRFDEDDKPRDEQQKKEYWRLERNSVVNAAEGWVRLWHQVLLAVQNSARIGEEITFLSLVHDLKEHYCSACAMLVSSEDTRPEIRSMIRWQLEELSLDEEDFEEWKDEQVRRAKDRAKKKAEAGAEDDEENEDGDQVMIL
jgi:hypothetical protein